MKRLLLFLFLSLAVTGLAFAGSTQTVTSSAIIGSDMTANTVTATQLAAQYSKGACTEVWGGSGTLYGPNLENGLLTIHNLKSNSGTRYICVGTSGQITSSASACSGT